MKFKPLMTGLAALAALVPAAPAAAAPGDADLAAGVDAALGGVGIDASMLADAQCRAQADAPGYRCGFRLAAECGAAEAPSDALACLTGPGPYEAILIGGDNGWFALDISHGGQGSAVPLDPLAPAMNRVSEAWLRGTWNPEGNCENDAGFRLGAGGVYDSGFSRGRWTLDDRLLTITVTEAADVEGSPLAPLDEPIVERWTIDLFGANQALFSIDDGREGVLLRC